MPSKYPEETPSRIKRRLGQVDKNLTKAIDKLKKMKYNTPQKVLLNLDHYLMAKFNKLKHSCIRILPLSLSIMLSKKKTNRKVLIIHFLLFMEATVQYKRCTIMTKMNH